MAKFENHESQDRVKVIIMGDSGSGKTGHLASLANAGYQLRVLDIDNKLGILRSYLDANAEENIHFITLRDDISAPKANAYRDLTKIIWNGWKTKTENLGALSEWDANSVLVIDSLTFLGKAAMHKAASEGGKPMNTKLTMSEWGEAIGGVESLIDFLTSDYFKFNLVVTALPIAVDDEFGSSKLYPQTVTKNFSMQVPAYFDNLIGLKARRDGSRYFRTISEPRAEYRTSNPKGVPKEMDANLAELFKLLRKGSK
jgi:hypothetical protein